MSARVCPSPLKWSATGDSSVFPCVMLKRFLIHLPSFTLFDGHQFFYVHDLLYPYATYSITNV